MNDVGTLWVMALYAAITVHLMHSLRSCHFITRADLLPVANLKCPSQWFHLKTTLPRQWCSAAHGSNVGFIQSLIGTVCSSHSQHMGTASDETQCSLCRLPVFDVRVGLLGPLVWLHWHLPTFHVMLMLVFRVGPSTLEWCRLVFNGRQSQRCVGVC